MALERVMAFLPLPTPIFDAATRGVRAASMAAIDGEGAQAAIR